MVSQLKELASPLEDLGSIPQDPPSSSQLSVTSDLGDIYMNASEISICIK